MSGRLHYLIIMIANVRLSPKKSSGLISSNISGRSAKTLSKSTGGKEPLLPATLAHVMRQHGM